MEEEEEKDVLVACMTSDFAVQVSALCSIAVFFLTPRRPGHISHTCLWAGGFQRHCKSFKIGQKPFYNEVNDKEW